MDYKLDAKKKPLGRLASEAAKILQGKHRADYSPEKVSSDRVLVTNFQEVAITGRKETDKVYYRHTGYVGHLKSETYKERKAKDPRRAIREAVRLMLPKNFLNARRLKNLIFLENDGTER